MKCVVCGKKKLKKACFKEIQSVVTSALLKIIGTIS